MTDDYRKQYDDMIARARIEGVKYDRGYEIHHIVPRCLGGSDEPRNLVKLWPKEHLRAHWLLSKFLVGSERLKMERVFEKMLLSRSVDAQHTISKSKVRKDALSDAEAYSAMPHSVRRKEGLSMAASKFLASELSCKGRRPLTKH